MNAVLEPLAKIGATRLIIMFGVAVGVAAALTSIGVRVGESDKALLFSDLELRAVSEITDRLDQAGIDYELGGGGSAIFVDKTRALSARIMLSADGLPQTGSVGYEIFDRDDSFGQTQFQLNVNRLRALEGELARTITAIDGVNSARVHLALPERRLFDRDASEPTASVWIELRHGDLAARHARAVRNLVAGAVPGLKPSKVTILDGDGRLLSAGATEDAAGAAGAMIDDRKASIEARVRQRVVDIVESVVGPGRVRAEVTADVDFDRVTESAEIFDPDGAVVRSTQVVDENSQEQNRENDGAVSVSENTPQTDGVDAASGAASRADTARTQEVINYEISRTTRTTVSEVGALQRLSVAVAVDGDITLTEDGETVYTPRSDEEMERIAALVRTAIGFDAARGDQVEVVNMRFAAVAPLGLGAPAPSAFAVDKNDIMRVAELVILLIVAMAIIFLVARPLVKGGTAAPAPALAGAGGGGSVALSAPGEAAPALAAPEAGSDPTPEPARDSGIDIAKIDGQVKASSVKKISEIVESHPDESVSIIRNWLHES